MSDKPHKKTIFEMIFKNPNAYVIIFLMILLCAFLTWIIPSGEFDRVEDVETGKNVVIPGSFKLVKDVNIGIFEALKAIPEGISDAAEIIAFSFIVCGSIHVIRTTGAIDMVLIRLVKRFMGREKALFIILPIIFSALGSLCGFNNEVVPFIPLGCAIAEALGYDKVVGFHLVKTSTWVGFAAATLNPFTIGVAQSIAEVPLYSGICYRVFCYIVFISITIWFTMNYAKRVKEDPKNSILYGFKEIGEKQKQTEFDPKDNRKITLRHKLILIAFLINLILVVVGSLMWNWGLTELAAVFFGFSIICGLIAGFEPNEIAKELVTGMTNITFGAIIIGFARGASVILEKGVILDTIVHGLSLPLIGMPPIIAAVLMFIVQTIINFFIGSGSGQAAAVIPIFSPLSDVIGLTRQTAVLAFQFGDGITNMFYPAGAMFHIAIAGIPYDRWAKHIFKLVMYLSLAAAVLVGIAAMINYGPF